MRRALEEDQYSANGSIVDTDSEDEDMQHSVYKGQSILRLDRAHLLQAARKHYWLGRHSHNNGPGATSAGEDGDGDDRQNKKKKKGKRKDDDKPKQSASDSSNSDKVVATSSSADSGTTETERDEGSIFGQTTGSSNATWVECDKCKKVSLVLQQENYWRRL